MAPQVIRLAQELARDHKTLQSLSMDRTTASYKLPPFLHLFSENPDTSRHLLKKAFSIRCNKAENQLPISQWHIGTDARQILRKLPADHPVKTEFYKAMKQAFELASSYIQSKFPLNNYILKTLTSIDPACHGTTIGATIMKRLKTYLPSVIPEAEHDAFGLEVNKYHLDKNIPKAVNEVGSSKRLDAWWAEVFDIDGYPHLSKVIKACLSLRDQ